MQATGRPEPFCDCKVDFIMATTDLVLDEPGSLPKPGPIGRLVRLVFGIASLWYVVDLYDFSDRLLRSDGHIRSVVWNGIVPGLFLISYVINIGFSRAWKKRPAIISAVIFMAIAGYGYVMQGAMETELLARAIWSWEMYLFSHLGVAFVLSALLATPGCEMRAFHSLYSLVTGDPTKEHHCPVGPLRPIDHWEAARHELK